MLNIHCYSEFRVASHADVLRGSSRVPAPLTSGAGTRDEPLPLTKQSTGYAFTNGYKNFETNQETNVAKAQADFQESPSSDLIMAQNFSNGC